MLNQLQKAEFLHNGFLQVKKAFNPVIARQCAKFVLERIDDPELDIDREIGYIHIKENFSDDPFSGLWSKKLESCVDSLLGKSNYQAITEWGWFPVSFPGHAPKEKVAPEDGWHIDGEPLQQLDDPEYAVICLCLFTDIKAWGGGTFIETASHKDVIRFMAAAERRGRGVPHKSINDYMQNRRFKGETVEINGKAGDVVLMNPYTWHCRGHNYSNRARVICNSRCAMKRRMNLQSPQNVIERSIVEAMKHC
ncbi:MAG: phytanoyl-CoA dioxygenase family protein [Pyrinomonadaceae bacterium]